MKLLFKYNISYNAEACSGTESVWADLEKTAIDNFKSKFLNQFGINPQVIKVSCVDSISFEHSFFDAVQQMVEAQDALLTVAKTQGELHFKKQLAIDVKKHQDKVKSYFQPPKSKSHD